MLVPPGNTPGTVRFVYLHAARGLVGQRLRARAGHFMPAAMLDGQFGVLEEPLEVDAVWVDAALPVTDIVRLVQDALALTPTPRTTAITNEEPLHDDPRHS
jgi:gluconokinase